MGRQSSAKRKRRLAGGSRPSDQRRQKSSGNWLQQRGARLGPSLAEFAAATEVDGKVWIRQRLLANHNIRMMGCGRQPPEYLAICWKPLHNITFLYGGLRKAGERLEGHPAGHLGKWSGHLRWGLDSVQQSVRLLLAGQLVGAAVLARGQLERWSENRAYNMRVSRRQGESTEDFIERVWNTNPVAFLGREMAPGDSPFVDGRRLSAGNILRGLTKIVHAEGHTEAVVWSNCGLESPPKDAAGAASIVSDALVLVTKQLMSGVSTLLLEQGKSRDSAISRYQIRMPPVAITPPAPSLWPINLLMVEDGLAGKVLQQASKYEAVFRGERPEGRLYDDGEMMLLCFNHYRARCIEAASSAFDAEAEYLGKALTLDGFSGTEMPPVMVSEMAAVLSSWLPQGSPGRAASAAIADALRGAFWLWLEDDNRAMACLRVVIEQAARLRVWRLKPSHGPRLEALGKPSRWISKAGWGRLAALNRALGEFSHYRPDVSWGGAFDLLVQLNHGVSAAEAPLTARRQALEVITRIVAKEICENVRCLNDDVAVAFTEISEEILAAGPEVDSRIDDYLNHAHSFRSHEFAAVPEMLPRARR